MDLESIQNVPLLEELRLKSNNGMNITGTLNPLLFCRLKHLVRDQSSATLTLDVCFGILS